VIGIPTVVHFDLPADDIERARTFYSGLFDWKFIAPPGFADFYLVETFDPGGNPSLGGGLGKRGSPDQRIMNYIGVSSIEQYCEKVQRLGGHVIVPKMIVPRFGFMAVCTDTEGNQFGLWQDDPDAG
jgi:predicted enzyme related to lactoylglutathione lyase